MDDLFQYLIWGIIIFSFLSSFFKKKEQPKPPIQGNKTGSTSQYPREQKSIELSTAKLKKDEYEILKELENLFKTEMKIPQQPKSNSSFPQEYSDHEISDRNIELENDFRIKKDVESYGSIEYRSSVEERSSIESNGAVEKRSSFEERNTSRSKIKPDKKIDAKAEQFEKVLAGLQKRTVSNSEFKMKIKNQVSIREYILFSEILGKPKALRK